MTKSKRSLLISVIVLVLTVVIAGSATFAWFTINEQVTVGQMDVEITTGSQGLYIASTKEGPFKTSLSFDEIKNAAGMDNIVDGLKLNNITSADGVAHTDVDGTAVGRGTKTFIEFSLFFRATGATMPKVQLSSTSSVDATTALPLELLNELGKDIIPAEYGKTADVTTINANKPIVTRGAYATRVSIQAFENMDSAIADGTAAKVSVWDPYYNNPNTFAGLANATGGRFDNSTGNLALEYYNKINHPDGKNEKEYPTGGIAPTKTKAEMLDVLKLKTSATNANYHEGRVVVRVWLEGFDGDCLNSVLNDKFSVQLMFNVEPTAVPVP